MRLVRDLRLSILATVLCAPAGLAQRGWGRVDAGAWRKPCLVVFQRSVSDALAIAGATARPLLVCANLDGEPASENFADIRYRDPAFAKLSKGFVCLVVSTVRHNPRGYDSRGRRIACPRFTSVTCGEHIALDRALTDRYFEGRRVAPRHMGRALDGTKLFDHFLEGDLALVDADLEKHGRPQPSLRALPGPGRPGPELPPRGCGYARRACGEARCEGRPRCR